MGFYHLPAAVRNAVAKRPHSYEVSLVEQLNPPSREAGENNRGDRLAGPRRVDRAHIVAARRPGLNRALEASLAIGDLML